MEEKRKVNKKSCFKHSSFLKSLLAISCLLLTLSVFSFSLLVNADNSFPTTNNFFQKGRIPDIQYSIIEWNFQKGGTDYIAQFSFPQTNDSGYTTNVTTTVTNSSGTVENAQFTYTWEAAYSTGSGAFNLFSTELDVDNSTSFIGYDFLYMPTKDTFRNHIRIPDSTWEDVAYLGTEVKITHLWQIAYFSNNQLVYETLTSSESIALGTTDSRTLSLVPPELRQWAGQVYVENCETIIEIDAPISVEMPVYTLPIVVSYSVNGPVHMYKDTAWVEENIEPDRDIRIIDIFTGVKNGLDVQLFGTFSILDLLYIVIGVSVAIAFLKLFSGG